MDITAYPLFLSTRNTGMVLRSFRCPVLTLFSFCVPTLHINHDRNGDAILDALIAEFIALGIEHHMTGKVLETQDFYELPLCSNTIVSTWLDCSRLMSDFSVRSREFIKACFCLETHRFLPLYVLGNRSKTLLLLIICKRRDLPTASRLRSKGTSLKSHRLNIRSLIHQAFLQIQILPFLLQ